jgi:dihydroxyacetone kinase-like predicted kinase
VRGLPASDELPEIQLVAATTEAEVVSAIAAAMMADGTGDPATAMRAAVARTRTATTTVDALVDDIEQFVRDDTELATVILGRGVSRAVADNAVRRLALVAPHVEVQVLKGRQANPAIILGAESTA